MFLPTKLGHIMGVSLKPGALGDRCSIAGTGTQAALVLRPFYDPMMGVRT